MPSKPMSDERLAECHDFIENRGVYTCAMSRDLLREVERSRTPTMAETEPAETLLARIDTLKAKVAALEAVVARLPKTKDGVPILPPMRVWSVGGMESKVVGCIDFFGNEWLVRCWPDWCRDAGEVYSTPQAAEAAKERP